MFPAVILAWVLGVPSVVVLVAGVSALWRERPLAGRIKTRVHYVPVLSQPENKRVRRCARDAAPIVMVRKRPVAS
jgi:hypothetical protein